MSKFEKFATFLGLFGVAMLVPGILAAFGIAGPSEFLESTLGAIGSASVLTLIAFAFIAFMVIFGTGENLSATLISLVIGFLLVNTAVEVGFMDWFRDIVSNVGFLSNPQLNYITGLVTVLLGVVFSYFKGMKFLVELAILVILPIGFLIGANQMGWMKSDKELDLNMNKGWQSLAQTIDEKYQNMPRVKEYIEGLTEDESLSEEEKQEKIKGLKDNIEKIEQDEKTLEELKKENEKYRKLLEEQGKNLSDFGWCASAKDTASLKTSYNEAVQPNLPCVRDFAVSLVKNHPGPYDQATPGVPTPEGIAQVCDIHVHLSSNWKYISDPTVTTRDYNSSPDRTIALGFAGDCDDFSILMASCVEAIGGRTRIASGFCSGGGHAWCEVMIGSKSDWEKAKKEIRKYYGRSSMSISVSKDEKGTYWLPLDWRLGDHSCNDKAGPILYDYHDRPRIQWESLQDG